MAFRDAARVECSMGFWRKTVCIEDEKRVHGLDAFEGVVECEEAGEVEGVC